MSLRVCFMGTPDFAVPSLEALLKSDDEVVGIVTQPDRPKGRGQEGRGEVLREHLQRDGALQPEVGRAMDRRRRLFVAGSLLALPPFTKSSPESK